MPPTRASGSAGFQPARRGILPRRLRARLREGVSRALATFRAAGRQDAGQCGLEARAPQDPSSALRQRIFDPALPRDVSLPDYLPMKHLLPLTLTLLISLTARAAIKAGFTERDITPEVGMEVPGGYGKSFSKRIHDPCKARIAVFDDGQKRVALIGIDALGVPRWLVLEARAKIQERCGIPGEAVMIAASHSHSSGPVGMVQKGEY